jgi:peptidyl-prolyl cis-trans isomerase A (cyclophilin A)
MGNITARLYEKDTPKTVENFVALAQGAKATRNPKTGAMVKLPLYTTSRSTAWYRAR